MKTPDIEIYVKNIEVEQLTGWLRSNFDVMELNLKPDSLDEKQSISGKLTLNSKEIPIVITPWAAGKSFSSIWFKSPETPWENDEACALSLLEQHDLEVRCSTGGWEEGEDEAGEYWNAITRNEKKLIRWG
jgi:hypothetical protein